MSSKRRLRRKACVGKIRHLTIQNAEYHAYLLRKASGEYIRAYPCGFCAGFHCGHFKKGEK